MVKKIYLILSLILFSIGVTLVDAIIEPNYFIKILIKIILFLFIPLLFCYYSKDDINKLYKFNKKNIFISISLGIMIYLLIVGGYFFTRNFIDYSNVTINLNDMGIDKNNFVIVGFYISLLNSFLEELFFRVYGFVIFKRYFKRLSWFFSPVLFSIYHLGMMMGMFNNAFLLLLLFGLFLVGILFNYLCYKFDNIYPAWFVHMFTNFGINTVALILFNM